MAKREVIREFRTLVSALRHLRNPPWLLRCVGARRSARIRTGAYPGTLVLHGVLRPGNAGIYLRHEHDHPEAEPRFRGVMKQLGYSRIRIRGYGDQYRLRIHASAIQLEAKWRRILSAIRTGIAAPRTLKKDRTGPGRPQPPSVIDQDQGWAFLEWLLSAPEGWIPEELFLRHERRFHVDGHEWIVDTDGYWEPPERKGVELWVSVTSRRPMTPREWTRLLEAGSLTRIQMELEGLGLRLELTPRLGTDDFEGRKPGCFLASFEGNVPAVTRTLPEVRTILNWNRWRQLF